MSEEGKMPAPQPPSPPAAPSALPVQAAIGDFQKLVLKTGVIVSAEVHPNADKLLVLKVDIGEAAPRQVVAGIRGSYQPEQLVGKQVVVVANLKPALLRGIESQGMVLAASGEGPLVLISPDSPVKAGSTVK